jgi:hypothetical protein
LSISIRIIRFGRPMCKRHLVATQRNQMIGTAQRQHSQSLKHSPIGSAIGSVA